MISVGGVYNWSQQWTFRSGVGYDQSPVTDGFRDTGVPDKSRVMIGIGGGYHFTPDTSVDFGYAHYFATGHASMNTSVNAIDPVTGVVVLHGTYDNSLDYLSVSFRTVL
jgi:long-chain fatty acid transport protein